MKPQNYQFVNEMENTLLTNPEMRKRLLDSCVGTTAEIPWPHRLLHDAADTLHMAGLLFARCLAHLEHENAAAPQSARELASEIRRHMDYPSISTPTRQHALPPGLPQFEGFVYTGEWRAPLRDEWFVAHAYDRDPRKFPPYAIPMRAVYHTRESPRYILRKLPAAQCEAMVSSRGKE